MLVWGVGGQTLSNTYNKLTIKRSFSVLYILGVLQDFQKLKISKKNISKVNFQRFFTRSRIILKVNDYDLHHFGTKNVLKIFFSNFKINLKGVSETSALF